jgi:hypothetical protein
MVSGQVHRQPEVSMGKHDKTDSGHVPAEQTGGAGHDKDGRDRIEDYTREDPQGFAVGREGRPDNYSGR